MAGNSLCVKTIKSKLVDGPNLIQITAKDTLGNVFIISDDIWMASRSIFIKVTGITDPIAAQFTSIEISIVDDPEVKFRRSTLESSGFSSRIQTPLNRLMFVAGHNRFGGFSWVAPLFFLSVGSAVPDLTLTPPSLASSIANSDLSLGTTAGWNKLPSNAEMSIVKHTENFTPKRSLRILQSIDYDINICTSKSNPTVRLFRGVRVGTGSTTAGICFRFSTNDVHNRHGYHVWLLAKDDAGKDGYESLVAGSALGLVRNGDPFILVDGNLTSSKWMTKTLPIFSNMVFVEVMITVHSQPDNLQPDLRSCINVDYLSVY